jgi:hypothetical protein
MFLAQQYFFSMPFSPGTTDVVLNGTASQAAEKGLSLVVD